MQRKCTWENKTNIYQDMRKFCKERRHSLLKRHMWLVHTADCEVGLRLIHSFPLACDRNFNSEFICSVPFSTFSQLIIDDQRKNYFGNFV